MTAPVVDCAALLVDAVRKPGVIAGAYRQFWNYSVGNQLLALWQCAERGLEPGPLNTFVGWRECGRFVRKGEKALTLCMPVTAKVKAIADERAVEDDEEDKPAAKVTRFIYRPHWFVLSQTDGEPFAAARIPDWQEVRCLEQLTISRTTFNCMDGNVQGYANERSVSVSPVAFDPHRTLFHEIAHVVLGHTGQVDFLIDDHKTERSIREVEAESVAMICCASLGLPGVEFSRGYIQHWLRQDHIPERCAQRIFKAADQILKAGYPSHINQETDHE